MCVGDRVAVMQGDFKTCERSLSDTTPRQWSFPIFGPGEMRSL